MNVFELVFIMVFLGTVVYVGRIAYMALRRRWDKVRRLTTHLGIGLTLYFFVLVAVSLLAPQRVMGMGEERCFDDWCIGVEEVTTLAAIGSGPNAASAKGVFYIVTVKVASHARRVSQRENGVTVILVDGAGHTYHQSAAGQRAYESIHGDDRPLSSQLGPGQSFSTVQVFDLPGDATNVGLVLAHARGPGWFVIGDDESLLHKKTVIRLKTGSAL